MGDGNLLSRLGKYTQTMAEKRVVIIDYGMGNLWSVASAIKHLGYSPQISCDNKEISRADLIILPGVGSFRRAMQTIESTEIDKAIFEALNQPQTRLLGICLGMQLLGKSSNEDGLTEGLGLVKNEVTRFTSSESELIKIPNIGYSEILSNKEMRLFAGILSDACFYFVHSYFMQIMTDETLYATAHHGQGYVAAFESGQIFGTQFHPEKSQRAGLKVLQNFLQ